MVHTDTDTWLGQKKWIMPSAATEMNLGIIILSEVTEEDEKMHDSSYEESKKWTYLQNRNRLTDVENKLMFTKGGKERPGGTN